MKTKSWVILGLQTLAIIIALIYALVQKGVANEMHQEAERMWVKAEANALEANRQKEIALKKVEETKRLQIELEACCKK